MGKKVIWHDLKKHLASNFCCTDVAINVRMSVKRLVTVAQRLLVSSPTI